MKVFSIFNSLMASVMLTNVMGQEPFHKVTWSVNNIVRMTGVLQVPPTTTGQGVPYLWPGLHPEFGVVLQEVLDGRHNNWYFGSTYYVHDHAEGGGTGFNVPMNDNLTFINEYDSKTGKWELKLFSAATLKTASYTYTVSKIMTRATLTIELYDNPWDFGPVIFKDVAITTQTTGRHQSDSWCYHPTTQNVTAGIGTITAILDNSKNQLTCKIDMVTLTPDIANQ